MTPEERIQLAQKILREPTAEDLMRFAASVAAAEREACTSIIEAYQIPVGNSAAGELAFEWTYQALQEVRAEIRARGEE